MSYEDFYGLKEQPFAITPDARFFYENEQHLDALIHMQHAIDAAKGLAVVIGDIGLGKTILSRKLFDRLRAEEVKYEAIPLVIIHHDITAIWLLRKIVGQLGVEFPSYDKPILIAQICQRLVEINETGKKVVLLIDEAHMLRKKTIFEELRGLLNVEGSAYKLLNIILFGPPELEKYMALDQPLVSRIGLKVTLKPLDHKATLGYIAHRLKVAGAHKEIFTPEACDAVFQFTKGNPRTINAVCDNALFDGMLKKKPFIEAPLIKQMAIDLGIAKE